jgi:hypothetical protein
VACVINKYITNINNASKSRQQVMLQSCGVTLTTTGVIYDHIIFFNLSSKVVNYAPRKFYSLVITHDDHNL